MGTALRRARCKPLQSHQSLWAGLRLRGLVKLTGRAWLSNRDQSASRCAVKGSQGSREVAARLKLAGLRFQHLHCQGKNTAGSQAEPD